MIKLHNEIQNKVWHHILPCCEFLKKKKRPKYKSVMNIVTSDTIKYSHSWALKKMRLQGKNVPCCYLSSCLPLDLCLHHFGTD